MRTELKAFLSAVSVAALFVARSPVYGQAPAAPAAADVPGLTLADDLKTITVPLLHGYAAKHPRLLFAAEDVAALNRKAETQPALWAAVLDSAKRLTAAPPTPEEVTSGRTYWRIERVESGALAYLVTGEKRYLDGAAAWMVAHARVPLWGNDYRPNLDLEASWYLYHIALAYDMLYNRLDPADRAIIRDGLAKHARAICDSFDPGAGRERFPFDQNHTYIPATALTTAALALLGDVPEADGWLKRAYAVMRRCRYALGEDGYYYEGCGYWSYALHWHVRYADLIARATGEKTFNLPVLRDGWKFPLYLSLPGAPYEFDIGDAGRWTGTQRAALLLNNFALLWGEAAALRNGAARATGDLYQARNPERDYPAAAFLWFDPTVPPAPLEEIKPYCHFTDHDAVAWRSGWGEDATCYLFRCGPPEGHLARDKLAQMKDWTMDPGHVHADIGGFWMFAKGAYLATGTGYTSRKWTRDQNTLLVDGQGQASDGSYWNANGFPYEKLNQARIDRVYLDGDYGFASGEFGAVYDRVAHDLSLRRGVLMTKRWLLVVDEMAAPVEHTLTWICHADGEFKPEGAAQVARLSKTGLAVLTLGGTATEPAMGSSTVDAGEGVGEKRPVVRGYQLTLTMKQPAKAARLVNLLVPLGDLEKSPEVKAASCNGNIISFTLAWPAGQTETVQLDLKPSQPAASAPGPAKITTEYDKAAASGYHVIKKVTLGGEGRWDYLAIDSAARRLYISRSSHVMVMDLDTDKVVGDIPGTKGVHGIAIAPELNRGFTSNGEANTSTIFDLETLKAIGEVKTGAGPDCVIYEPASKRVFTFNGDGNNATAFDAASAEVVGTIPLGGCPEYASADGQGRVYVNIVSTSEVVEIDSAKLAVTKRFPLAPGKKPSGLAVDAAHHLVFSGCSNRIMTVLDVSAGKVIACVPIGRWVDANGFDPGTGLAFSSNGEGTLTVARETAPGKFEAENVATEDNAQTMALDLRSHNVYLATARFEPKSGNPQKMVKDSFMIVVVGR